MADEAGGGVGVGRRYTSFGLGLVGVSGAIQEVGDSREESTLMSVAKPFVFALAAQSAGIERVVARVGVDPTGLPFNSAYAVERTLDGRTNPMVDAGAIATASLVPGAGLEERWLTLTGGLSTFAGRELGLDQEVLVSARRTNFRNRALAMLLRERGAIDGDPLEATELYTRGSCLRVTAVDLAVMGATLADGGVNPLTGVRVVSAEVARAALVVMAVAGLYETSGDWLLRVSVSPARAGSVAGWSRSPRAGQGRPRVVLPAAGPRGQQRARSARRPGAVLRAGPGHPGLRGGGARGGGAGCGGSDLSGRRAPSPPP